MTEFEIKNRLSEIRDYISSPYFRPDQAKMIYAERDELEKMLESLKSQDD
jgi:hypothetical protein